MTSDAGLPLLLTAQEVAEVLRTSRKAIYAMIERHQVPGVTRIGRRVLVRSDHLMKWLDQQPQVPAAAGGKSAPVTELGARR